ncbi:MAG: TonB-dependent receptor [Burkholderiales bacterium]|nr:TonB-dependent receptor [Burkholderiales bacterium]
MTAATQFATEAAAQSAVQSGERCQPTAGKIVSVQGNIELRAARQAQWQPAKLDDALCAGDTLRVKEFSRGSVALANETLLRLDEKTTVTLVGVEETKPSLLELCRGAIHFMTRTRKSLRIITPFVNAAVEGTEFAIDHANAHDTISVYEGRVSASNEPDRALPETCEASPASASEGGTLLLASGESARIPINQAPFKLTQVVARPEDSVQWALYYPPLGDYRSDEAFLGPGNTTAPQIRESIAHYRAGRITEALSSIEQLSENQATRDPRFHTYRAEVLLAAGRVDEANLAIQQALNLDPRNSAAYALRAIIGVAQNDKAAALIFARNAVRFDEKSAAALIALSYAEQASFEIGQALASARKAVKHEPQNALAWARVAELEMSLGKLDDGLQAAQRAADLNPNLARAQTVLGFANLTRIDTKAAKASFEKAIALDQTDPLPRLGLGLARIRESDLEAGRREIEIAVNLDPASSLLRSYLGKAYFEERRENVAGTQLDIAKELDPRDPTPWFYDAIRKQTINQPVEALRDLEKSIELNDNRAVYRSELLLDRDRAVRDTSLGRIYDDLGFDQLALVESSKSLSIDPANHSAHRFLSDTYARLPRHEIARVSELLQAQLLQPINVNPVQPRLSVTDLNIIAGAGPAEAAFNEFTPLFERNRPQFVVSGIAGNNDTLGDEAVLSGLAGRLSYSLGQFHYETDGFRQNNDLRHDIYNVFAQYAVTPSLNVQAELRRRRTRNGDLALNFDPDVFSVNDRRELEQDVARVGAHWSPSPRQDVLFSLIYSDREEDQRLFQDITIDDTARDRGYQAEAQYLFRASGFNTAAGAGTSRIEVDERQVFDLSPLFGEPCPSFIAACDIASDFKRERDNAYIYANIDYWKNVLLTAGLSYDSFRDADFDLHKLNPKLGLQWNVTDDLRFRLAAFQTVKPSLVVDQTLEPTQIAGFNQFFDDVNGTEARRYGLGVDWRLTNKVDVGAEVSRRNLEVPDFEASSLSTTLEKRREKLYRAYLYWTPFSSWAFSGEYLFEKFERDAQRFEDRPIEIETSSVPFAVRYFASRGLFGESVLTYIHQRVERFADSALRDGSDSFVLLDAAVGYRLPGRRGIISLEARNLLDKKFLFQDLNFQTSEVSNPRFIPDRTIAVRFTFNF